MAKRSVTLKELREGVRLAAGEAHVLVLTMGRHTSLLIEGAVFAFDSAFPAAGIFLHLGRTQEILDEQPGCKLVVFGHTDVKGKESYNKTLSEKRAKAVLAMIERDVGMLDQVAEEEEWGTDEYQVMLRVLGCNPGAIDGVEGAMTEAAVRGFQRGYNNGIYHDDPDAPARAHDDLVVDGKLGPKTKAALRDAYAVSSPCRIDDSRLNDPAFAGCSELNPISDRDELNRRVMIAFVESDGPDPSEYPCKEGDVGACPRDGNSGQRCLFYLQYFSKFEELDAAPFFDFRWLREQSGAAHLSALTTLPDGPAQFTVYRYDQPITEPMPSSSDSGARPSSPGDVLGVVQGEIRGGVAFARWIPPDGFDPFDYPAWLVDHDVDFELFAADHPDGGEVDTEALLDAKGMRPPVFLVESGEHWGFSFPPSHSLDDVRITHESTGPGVAVGYDAGLVPWQATDGRTSPSNSLPPDVGILALVMAARNVAPEDPDGDEGDTPA